MEYTKPMAPQHLTAKAKPQKMDKEEQETSRFGKNRTALYSLGKARSRDRFPHKYVQARHQSQVDAHSVNR